MEAVESEEIQKPTAKKSSKRGRKSKKNNTKALQESSEITHDDKSDTKDSESSPELKDTTIYSQNVVQNNVTENVLIDESITLESPEKSIVSPKIVTIVEVDSKKSKNSMEPEDKVEDEKTKPIIAKNNKTVETGSSEITKDVPVVVETAIMSVEKIKTIEPAEEMICSDEVQVAAPTISENIDKAIEPVETMICSDEVQTSAKTIIDSNNETVEPVLESISSEVVPVESIAVVVDAPILSSNEVKKIEPVLISSMEVQDTVPMISTNKVEEIEPVEEMDCSEVVQEVASSAMTSTIEQVEEINRTVDVPVDSTPMISDEKDEKIEPVMKNNEIEIKIKKEKDISDTPVEQEVLNKSPIKEIATRKSESYTVEQLENIEERCESPDLMDESVVTIMDSPPPLNASATLAKDSTFSPVVDISINDSRPTIDVPLMKRNNPIRTSTPLAPKLFLTSCENQKSNRKLMLNPLEKSILKSNRRKRSLSMVEGESFMQKRVMFISPTVMDIESIDNKMMASFFEEKENSSKFNNISIYVHINS